MKLQDARNQVRNLKSQHKGATPKLGNASGKLKTALEDLKAQLMTRANTVNPSFPIRVENHEFKNYFGYFWPSIEVYGVEMASNRV